MRGMSTATERREISRVYDLKTHDPYTFASALNTAMSIALDVNIGNEECQQVSSFFQTNLENTSTLLSSSDENLKTVALRSIMFSYAYFFHDQAYIESVNTVIDRNSEVFSDCLETDRFIYPIYISLLRNDDTRSRALEWLLDNPEKSQRFIETLSDMFPTEDFIKEAPLMNMLYGFGFSIEEMNEMIVSWKANYHDSDLWNNSVKRNMLAILELERVERGSSKELYAFFGIVHFNRYNPQVLYEQLVLDDTEKQNIVLLTGHFDVMPNNQPGHETYSYSDSTLPDDIKASGGRVIFAEFGRNIEKATHVLEYIGNRFGKADMLIWRFHSNTGKILDGWEYRQNPLATSDDDLWKFQWLYTHPKKLLKSFIPSLNSVVREGGNIIFGICEASQFIQKLHGGIHHPMTYSDDGILASLEIVKEEDYIEIIPQYVRYDRDTATVLGEAQVVQINI
jgi:hypothetical protein